MTEHTDTIGTQCELVERVTRFICASRRIERLDPNTKLFEAKVINSMFIVQLINFVENDIGVTLDDEDLDIANFESVNRIAKFVQAKQV